MTTQDRAPNFRKNQKLYLVRCFACDHESGRENYGPAVASGECAWCGWKEENSMKKQKISKEFKVWVLVRDGEPMRDEFPGGGLEVYNSRADARSYLFNPDESVRPARLIVDLSGKG